MSCFSSKKQNKNDRNQHLKGKAKTKKKVSVKKISIEEISYTDEEPPKKPKPKPKKLEKAKSKTKTGCFSRGKAKPKKQTSSHKHLKKHSASASSVGSHKSSAKKLDARGDDNDKNDADNDESNFKLQPHASQLGLPRKPVMRVAHDGAIEQVEPGSVASSSVIAERKNLVMYDNVNNVSTTPSKTRKVREIFEVLSTLEAKAATLSQQQSTLTALKREETKFDALIDKHEQLNRAADEAIDRYEQKVSSTAFSTVRNRASSTMHSDIRASAGAGGDHAPIVAVKSDAVVHSARQISSPTKNQSNDDVPPIPPPRMSLKRMSKSTTSASKLVSPVQVQKEEVAVIESNVSFVSCRECVRGQNRDACLKCFSRCYADVQQRWQRDDSEAVATASYLDRKFQREQQLNTKVRQIADKLEQQIKVKQAEIHACSKLFREETKRQKQDLEERLERTRAESTRLNRQLSEMREQRAQAYEQLNRIRQRFKIQHEDQLKQAKAIIERVEHDFRPIEMEIGTLLRDSASPRAVTHNATSGDHRHSSATTHISYSPPREMPRISSGSAARFSNLSRRSQKVVEGLRRVGSDRISAMKAHAVDDLLNARKRYRKWRDRRDELLRQRKQQQVAAFVDYVGERTDDSAGEPGASGGGREDDNGTVYYDASATIKTKPELVDTALPDVVNWGKMKSGTEIDNMIESWLKQSSSLSGPTRNGDVVRNLN